MGFLVYGITKVTREGCGGGITWISDTDMWERTLDKFWYRYFLGMYKNIKAILFVFLQNISNVILIRVCGAIPLFAEYFGILGYIKITFFSLSLIRKMILSHQILELKLNHWIGQNLPLCQGIILYMKCQQECRLKVQLCGMICLKQIQREDAWWKGQTGREASKA